MVRRHAPQRYRVGAVKINLDRISRLAHQLDGGEQRRRVPTVAVEDPGIDDPQDFRRREGALVPNGEIVGIETVIDDSHRQAEAGSIILGPGVGNGNDPPDGLHPPVFEAPADLLAKELQTAEIMIGILEIPVAILHHQRCAGAAGERPGYQDRCKGRRGPEDDIGSPPVQNSFAAA